MTAASEPAHTAAYDCLGGGGTMGALMRTVEWAMTSIGPIESWSPTLRMMVRLILSNRLQMFLWWGPRFCQIYNDAAWPALGTKHPGSMGQSASECWPEIWHIIGPLIEAPFNGGEATWMDDILLEINRNGFTEETHWTIAYSPVPDDSAPSRIGGVIGTVNEITEKVVRERRVGLLRDLGARSSEAKTAEEACAIAANSLEHHREDAPFGLLYLISADRKCARLAGATGISPQATERWREVDLGATASAEKPWPLAEAIRSESMQIVADLEEKLPSVPPGPWSDPPQTAVVCPVPSNIAHQFAGLLVLGISSRLAFDDHYRGFCELVTSQVATAIANARAWEEQRKRAEALAQIGRVRARASQAALDREQILRKSAEDAEMRTKEELAAELAAMNRLHELSTRLLAKTQLQPLLEEALEATMTLQSANMGCMQFYDTATEALEIVAQRGFAREFVEHFRSCHDQSTICGRAVLRRERVIVEDVMNDADFRPHLSVALSAGYRAVQSTPLFARNGDVLGMLSTYFCKPYRPSDHQLRFTDLYARQAAEMIERKRAEEVLRASEERFRRYFDLGLIGMAITSGSKECLEVNDELCRILGYERDELLRMTWAQITHPDDLAADAAQFNRVLAGEIDGYTLDKRWIRKDGRVIHSIMAAKCMRRADGSIDYLVGLVLDTTESRRAEARLAESERRFRLLAESIPHHVWSYRADGSVGYWNQRLIDYVGLTPEERQEGGWAALHPDDVERVKAAWEFAFAHGTDYEMEQRVRGRDGRYRRFVCRGVPIRDEQGRPVEWFGTDTDVEDRQQAEESLAEARSELARMMRATTMGELAASIAHEVKQPLAAIVANGNACARWLAATPPNLGEANRAIERIVRDTNRAAEIVTRIRTFLRRGPVQRAQVDVNEVIADVIATVQGELRTKGVSLILLLPDGLPSVHADRVQLQQVILNLVMNAIDAMRPVTGQAHVLEIRTGEGTAKQLRVSVSDSGVGLDPDQRERLFEAFHTTKPDGMGMGLAISRSIVEAHGGRLWATPNEGPGATFHMTLPLAIPAEL